MTFAQRTLAILAAAIITQALFAFAFWGSFDVFFPWLARPGNQHLAFAAGTLMSSVSILVIAFRRRGGAKSAADDDETLLSDPRLK
jgi:hypothetical protein